MQKTDIGISVFFFPYTALRGGGTIEKGKLLQEDTYGGFRVLSYLEELTKEERKRKDQILYREASKILTDYYKRVNQEGDKE